MAIATATAIGLGISAAATGASFAQAGKQRKLQREAQAEAQKAMQEARKKLEVNYYEQLGIQKEPYELEREALLSSGAQIIEAGVESERGAAATAGRVQMAQQAGQRQIAAAMGQEMAGIQKAIVGEDTRLRDMGLQLDLGEVAGAQLAERDAQQAAAAATTQAFQGLQGLGQQIMQAAPLYGRSPEAEKAAIGQMSFTPEQFQKFGNVAEKGGLGIAGTDGFTNLDFQKIGEMNNAQYGQLLKALTPQQRQMLFTNKQFSQLYNPFNPF